MIVETSALVAIVAGEPEREAFSEAVLTDRGSKMCAANYLEAGIVIDALRRPRLRQELDVVIDVLDIEIVAFSAAQAAIARQAYRDFGKGSGHPAQLNFGDCFAYALAVDSGDVLLYSASRGDDFGHTDVRPAR